MNNKVLVVGAGVAGMKASVELIQQGFEVILLERESRVGGKMAKEELSALGPNPYR
jgi:heterodisulfide reductase subunit A-like polyferredoxin